MLNVLYTPRHLQVPGENDFGEGEMEGVFPSHVTLLDGVPMPVLNLNGGEEGEQGLR